MSNSNDQQSTSDDLISELARLMAEEAQSRNPAAQAPAPKSENPPEQEAEEARILPEGGKVVRVPGDKPASTANVPAGSVWGRDQDSGPAAEAPVVAPAQQSETRDPALSTPTGFGVADTGGNDEDTLPAASERSSSVAKDVFGDDFAEHPDQPEAQAPAMGQDAPDGDKTHDYDDPIAILIAEQEREEAERAVQQRVESKPASSVRVPAPPAQKAGRSNQDTAKHDDDVLSLVRAMSTSQHGTQESSAAKDKDTFSSSPVFGLDDDDGQTQKSASSDPLDEIESLIGDAMKLPPDSDRSDAARLEPTPDLDDAAYAAEAAIAAAAADTGRSGRQKRGFALQEPDFESSLDDAIATTRGPEPDAEEAPVPANNRLIVGAAAAATVLVAVALGLFWVFGMNEQPDGSVPVLASNTVDAKETPEQDAATNDTTQPAIFDELDGTTNEAPADEQIVSRDQSGDVTNEVRAVTTSETAEAGLANRKVRTVTVRPDGTIVPSEDTVAANEVLPVVRPNVPVLSNDIGDTAIGDTAAPVEVATLPDTDTAVVDPLAAIVDSATQEAAALATGEAEAIVPYPLQRPTDLQVASTAAAQTPGSLIAGESAPSAASGNTIDLIADTANQRASQLPTATATTVSQPETVPATTTTATAAATDGPDAAAYVQLSSQRDLDSANITLAEMSQRYQGQFNGAEPFVRRVDLGERGIYFRVLVPANSLADANGVCASVKAAGGDCFVRTN